MECFQGFYLLGLDCPDKCPVGMYGDDTLKKCVACHTSCKECNKAGINGCTLCKYNTYLLN